MLYIPPFFSDADDSSTRSSRIPLKFQGAELRPDSDPVPPQTTMRVYEEVSCTKLLFENELRNHSLSSPPMGLRAIIAKSVGLGLNREPQMLKR